MNEKKHSLMKTTAALRNLETFLTRYHFLRYFFLFVFSQHICVCDDLCVCCCFFNSIVPFDVLFHWWSFNFDTYSMTTFSLHPHIYFSLFLHQHFLFHLDSLTNFFLLVTCTIFIYHTLPLSPRLLCVSFGRSFFFLTLAERFEKEKKDVNWQRILLFLLSLLLLVCFYSLNWLQTKNTMEK